MFLLPDEPRKTDLNNDFTLPSLTALDSRSTRMTP
jgi:hypothetical protein